MRSVPISRPGPIAFAVAAAVTIGVIPATAAVPADTGPMPFVGAVDQPAGSGGTKVAVLDTGGLDYAVDTDKAGRADRQAQLMVTASHLSGTTAAIGKPSLEVSYDDGATWQGAELSHKGDGWRTGLHAPKSARFVTLRVTAKDSADNSVSQTITRAFGLR